MKDALSLLAAACTLALAGCADLGPSPPPSVDMPARWTTSPLPTATAGTNGAADRGQAVVQGRAGAADWWSAFGGPPVDELVRASLAANPGLAAAEATLRQSNELAKAQSATLWPALNGSVSAVQARGANAGVVNSGAPRSRTALLSASYSPDFFGAGRFAAASAQAQADAARWQLAAARLSLEGAVLAALAAEKSSLRQEQLLGQLVDLDAKLLAIVGARESLGDLSRAAVWAQEQQLHDRRAQLAAARLQTAQARNLLASLSGQAPASFVEPAIDFDQLQLPDVPLALPGDVVRRRPDVQLAEAQLRSADAARQAAVAGLLPQVTLTADAGYVADAVRHLFNPASFVWDAGVSATQTLLDAGAQRHRVMAARAAADAQAAQYRAAIVSAFKDVADALEALRNDADASVEAIARAGAAARQSEIAVASQSLGELSSQDVLAAQEQLLQAQSLQVQARAARFVDTVNVMVALGGAPEGGAAMPPAGTSVTARASSSSSGNPPRP